jgi:hypothetical protein
MSDDRLFFKLHNGFPEHPKTIELSDKAFRQLVEAWCYCSRNLNDGYLTSAQFSRFFSPKSRGELLQVGFVRAEENMYVMHDYLEHQQSAQQVADLRERRKAAGSKGGKAKANGLASAKQMPEQMPSKPLPDTDTDLDTDPTEAKASVSHRADEFMDWYLEYPRKASRAVAEKAYAKARKKATANELLEGVKRYAADPNREQEFTKLPATWLNGGCWDDGPLPVKGGVQMRPTGSQIRLQAGLELMQRAQAKQERQANIFEIEG